MNIYAKNLFFLRKLKKCTQEETCAAIDVSRTTWSNYENGVSEPSLAKIIDIALFFNANIHDMLTIDLSQNDYLNENLTEKIERKNDYLNSYRNDYPNKTSEVNEPEIPLENALKREVDLLILRQLNTIAEGVAEIRQKLP